MKKLILHLGYNKTGTTTLQKLLFPNISNATTIMKGCNDKNILKLTGTITDSIKMDDNFDFSKKLDSHRAAISKIIGETDKNIIIGSSETFIGHRPNLDTVENRRYDKNYGLIFDRINDVFCNPNEYQTIIIIVVRKQKDFIRSYYNHTMKYYRNQGIRNINDFVYKFGNYPKDGLFGSLRYHTIARNLDQVFGSENVHVLLYEDFKFNRSFFFAQLGKLLEVSVDEIECSVGNIKLNTSMDHRNTRIEKIISRIFGTVGEYKIWKKLFSKNYNNKISLSKNSESIINELFYDENINLAQNKKLGLQEYGYY